MGLSSAISAALSGLRISQTGVGLVADNVANADTPGYIRKSLLSATTASSGGGSGVRLVGVARELDQFVQRQLRAELAGASYANARSTYHARLDQIYGTPGSLSALDTLFNNFTNSLQALATSPESIASRNQVLNEAMVLTQHLNSMSGDVQELRSLAETSIDGAVDRINEILQGIETISLRIVAAPPEAIETAALLDQRDNLVAELSALIDVRVVDVGLGQITIFTHSGVSLFDHRASRLAFDGRDGLGPQSLWSSNSALRQVGTLTLTSPNGYQVDLIENRSIRSGSLAAHLQMRDQILVEAQAQLDEIAAGLALALSNRSVGSTAASSGAQAGFTIDLADLQNGNAVTLTYTDNGSGQQRTVTIVRVDDPAALPLGNEFTANPNDQVIGVSFAGGFAGVISALNSALGATGLAFDNPSGMLLRVLDDGAPDLVDVDALSASVTTNIFGSGDPSLPFFVDGGSNGLYTGFVTATGRQQLGFAARIAVNTGLRDDPSRLIAFATGTPAGDSTRPDYLFSQLTTALRQFGPATGIGTRDGPYTGTITDFMRQAIAFQGAAAENANRLKEGQDIVVNALQARFSERSSVNIDSEMAHLLTLQTAYGANARVLTAVREMLDALMRI